MTAQLAILRMGNHLAGQSLLVFAQSRVGQQGQGGLVVVRFEPQVGADALARRTDALDFVATEAAELPHLMVAGHELGRGRIGETAAWLQLGNLVVALETVALGQARGRMGKPQSGFQNQLCCWRQRACWSGSLGVWEANLNCVALPWPS